MNTNRSLSISHIHWAFLPTIGGVETHLSILMPELVRRGHKVSLLTGSFDGVPDKHTCFDSEIFRSSLMDLNWLLHRGHGGLDKKIRKMFTEYIDQTKPDIIHAHNLHYYRRVYAVDLLEIANKKGIPVVLTAHNVWDDPLFLELARDVDWKHIIAVSDYVGKELAGVGCLEEKITTIYHGVDTKVFKPGLDISDVYERYPQLKNKKVIFHPARMSLDKGCDLSIKAFNIVKKEIPDAMLVLSGSKNVVDWKDRQAKDIEYFNDLINHYGLADDIIIDSFSLDEMPMMYNVADVSVYPSSVQEPFGLTMLESMACSKPIVVTRSGGMKEIIKDDVNGYVVDIKDFTALADKIKILLQDLELSKRLGKTGRAMVETSYTERDVGDKVLGVYNKILSA